MSNIQYKAVPSMNTTGTSKKGTVTTSYNGLVSRFGEPHKQGDSYVFNEWFIVATVPEEDGDFETITATIYDWNEKTDPAERPDEIITFMIGGHSMDAAYYIHQIMAE